MTNDTAAKGSTDEYLIRGPSSVETRTSPGDVTGAGWGGGKWASKAVAKTKNEENSQGNRRWELGEQLLQGCNRILLSNVCLG